jgi:hypothetical protein
MKGKQKKLGRKKVEGISNSVIFVIFIKYQNHLVIFKIITGFSAYLLFLNVMKLKYLIYAHLQWSSL